MGVTRNDSKEDLPQAGNFPARIARVLRLTRIGMIWEQIARAFWPLAALLAMCFAALSFGLASALSPMALRWVAGAAVLALIAAAIWGGRRYRPVSRDAALARVDDLLPGRPLSALQDSPAIGGDGALWQAHLAQMQTRANAARAVRPDADLKRRDPLALRLAAMVALVMALVFGGASELGRGMEAIASTFRAPADRVTDVAPTGPGWEGWAEPPAYTRRPTIYLNALQEDQALDLPKGSVLSFRLYSPDATLEQDIGSLQGDDPAAPGIRAEQSGTVQIAGRRFDVTVQPDDAPVVRPGQAPERRADGRMVQSFEASDDYGIALGQARIDLDLAAVTREFGLAADPEPRDALELKLPLPARSQTEIKGQLVEDLSRHPWANLPVQVTLRVEDGIAQEGLSQSAAVILPGRRFFDPMAAALIELRRDLLWSRDNAGRSAEILRALTWQPEGFVDDTLYLQLRGSVNVLETDRFDAKARDELAEALWQAALKLEDGGLSDALEKMQRAQEKLSEAIRNGASPDEIQRLMDELKDATDAYTQMLAEQGESDPSERFTRNQPTQRISGDQIQQMMDEIQRLMNEGRMAEAQELLEQFNRMMENLRITNDTDPNGPSSNRPMNRLADTLRQQQDLSDEAFRQMQRQFGQQGQQGGQSQPGQQGQQGQDGQQGESGGDLAQRQRQLREELGQQRGLMPGQGSESGDEARRQLDEAGRAMEEAERALRDGNMGEAMQRQADAIEAMRQGMRALGDMLGQRGDQQQAQEQGQEGQDGQPEGPASDQARRDAQGQRALDNRRDPLGRSLSGDSDTLTSQSPFADGADPARRARDLLDEIRRRTGEMTRPQDERDYLGRLLERF